MKDTIESGRYLNVPVDKIRGYAYKSLKIICDNSDYKRSDEFVEYQEVMRELLNKEINKSKTNYGLHNRFEIDNDELHVLSLYLLSDIYKLLFFHRQ